MYETICNVIFFILVVIAHIKFCFKDTTTFECNSGGTIAKSIEHSA